jgi:hypothetical protein
MAVRMKGKEMMCHQQSKKGNHLSLTESYPMATMTTTKSLTDSTPLMASITTSDSPEGLWSATCTAQPSKGKFADTGCQTSSKAPLSPDGNIGVKSPDILEGLFEKSFCSTKQLSLFLSS